MPSLVALTATTTLAVLAAASFPFAAASEACTADSQCVPKGCCHSSECAYSATGGPVEDCAAVMCTRMCMPGTLDCGQGHCVCGGDGACAAVFEAPAEACKVDSDCVPSTCCSPNQCVAKAFAPDCSDTACVAMCTPNSFDCGQGHCGCDAANKRCVGVFAEGGLQGPPAGDDVINFKPDPKEAVGSGRDTNGAVMGSSPVAASVFALMGSAVAVLMAAIA